MKEALRPFKKAFIILGVFILLLVALKAFSALSAKRTEQSPIVGISAENRKKYSTNQEIKVTDFTIYEEHENGKKTEANDPEKYELSRTSVNPVGKKTRVTISSVDDSNYSCEVDVLVKRDKILGFHCGYPNSSDVIAVLYSNGELCFEGEGDILQFDEGDFPWQDYEGMDEYPITAISFEDTVTPISLDNCFSNIDTLTYVAEIPSSVQSMSNTFSSCTSLVNAPEWGNCKALLNITSCYEDCVALKHVPAVPENVRNGRYAFSGCEEMQDGPDLTKAVSLVNASAMFENDKKLTGVSMPPNVENISSMFAYCINLKVMPEIPETVKIMDDTFEGDITMQTLTRIPAKVESMSRTFSDCGMMEGTLVIDANPEGYSGCLSNVAVATKLDLTGKSKLLNEIALSADENPNVTVNGKEPVEKD